MCMERRIIFGEMREREEIHVLRGWRCSQTFRQTLCERSVSSQRLKWESVDMTLTDDSSEEVEPQMWAYILKASDKSVKLEQWLAIIRLSGRKVKKRVDHPVLNSGFNSHELHISILKCCCNFSETEKTINYKESVSVCNIVSKFLSKQKEISHSFSFLFFNDL